MPRRVVVARTFARDVHFLCPDAAVADALSYLSAQPIMPQSRPERLELEIISLGAGFYDFKGDLEGSPGTANHMMFPRANKVLSDLFLKEISSDPAIAAGSVLVNDRRFLVLADDQYDRLIFIMNCLSEGARVESDGFVVVRDNVTMAVPKRLRIDRQTARLFPKLLADVLASPSYIDWYGNVIYALDPGRAGTPWQISSGPADVLLFLEPNPGGTTSVGRLPVELGFERLLRNFRISQGPKGASLAKLHRLSRSAACWKMRIGTFKRSLWHLERIAEAVNMI